MSQRTSRQQAQFDSYKAVKARERALLRQHARRSVASRVMAGVIGLAVVGGAITALAITAQGAIDHAAARRAG